MKKRTLTAALALLLMAAAPAAAPQKNTIREHSRAVNAALGNRNRQSHGAVIDSPHGAYIADPNDPKGQYEELEAIENVEDEVAERKERRNSDPEAGNRNDGKAYNASNKEKDRPDKSKKREAGEKGISFLGWGLVICLVLGVVASLVVALQAMGIMKRHDRELTKMRRRLDEAEERLESLKADQESALRSATTARQIAETAQQASVRAAATAAANSRPAAANPAQTPTFGEFAGATPAATPTRAQVAPLSSMSKPKIKRYATANAKGTPEFYKVTPANDGDKVFLLELDATDSTTASFSVIPDLGPDKVRSLAANKDTYLPSSIVERTQGSQAPTRIVTESAGEARLDGNVWTVVRQARIRIL